MGVGCHFLLQCVKVKSLSRPTLSNPMDCSLPGSSIHGIFQARVLEWGAIAFSDLTSLGTKKMQDKIIFLYVYLDLSNRRSSMIKLRYLGFPSGSDGKESACNSGDPGSTPRSGRSHRERHGDPLQYSCLENPMDRGAWRTTVHGVAKSWTRLSDFTFTFHFHALEKEMATHSHVLAWRIPGTGEPGGLPSMGSHRVGHDCHDLAAAAAEIHLI